VHHVGEPTTQGGVNEEFIQGVRRVTLAAPNPSTLVKVSPPPYCSKVPEKEPVRPLLPNATFRTNATPLPEW